MDLKQPDPTAQSNIRLLASLPMYARPELVQANASLWNAIGGKLRDTGIEAPHALTSDGVGNAFWGHPDLLFSQTCGYPYRTRLRDSVQLIGTPDYGLEDCPAGYYYSVFVVRDTSRFRSVEELNGAAFAFNDRDSQSGYHGPLDFCSARSFALQVGLEAGSHVSAAKAVADGKVDVAAIDAVTWRHMLDYDGFTENLRVIGKTKPVPGLPFITARADLVEEIRDAVQSTIYARLPAVQALGIIGLVQITPEGYSAAAFMP